MTAAGTVPLVGLCGFAGAGKDTAALGLAAAGWARLAFADALRDEVAGVLGMDPDEFRSKYEGDPAFKESVRPLLVAHGARRRSSDRAYWIDIMRRRIEGLPPGCPGAVITDIRYRDEGRFVREDMGGVVIRIERPGTAAADREERRTVPSVEADATLRNDGTAEDLWNRAAGTAARLLREKRGQA
ncbi:MAG TPA: hypothetical protein PKV69_00045 [Candidatus Hydrogenedentes bacterium]|nr:hypothetical protein [Candidatus Hydrogenedentota bacterium]